MTHFAYLRVSTDRQDTQNQKLSVLEYSDRQGMSSLVWVEDTLSGKAPWRERALGALLEETKTGDTLLVAEVSRLGRSTLQVLEILEYAAQKGISVHIAKNQLVMDGSLQATITATILGLAAQIEREFISARTKEALQKIKQEGGRLGRPLGHAEVLKLDAFQKEILAYLKKGINKRAIAKLIECSPSTLYKWLKRRQIRIF